MPRGWSRKTMGKQCLEGNRDVILKYPLPSSRYLKLRGVWCKGWLFSLHNRNEDTLEDTLASESLDGYPITLMTEKPSEINKGRKHWSSGEMITNVGIWIIFLDGALTIKWRLNQKKHKRNAKHEKFRLLTHLVKNKEYFLFSETINWEYLNSSKINK